jgi:hypothetical protein
VTFYHNDSQPLWGTMQENWMDRNRRDGCPSRPITVQAVSFVEALRQYGVPHYMNVDIEGSDMICVRALYQVNERPDYLSIESSKLSLHDVEAEMDGLILAGYREFMVVQQTPHAPSSGPFGKHLTGPWLTKAEALERYREIFENYTGWHDTHARL